MKNYKEDILFSSHQEYIQGIVEDFENRFGDFKRLEEDISIFSQPLTINIETVSNSDLQLEFCDLQSDHFYIGEKKHHKTFLNFFQKRNIQN